MAYNPNIPAPTNRVQDDIAAMRDNFQHLAPLAQAVDELQTVSELAAVAGELQAVSGLAQAVDDLQAVSELAPYIQAILGSRIVDHNLDVANPSSGWYVRLANGFQVCTCLLDVSGIEFTAQGSLFMATLPAQPYPAQFTRVFDAGGNIGGGNPFGFRNYTWFGKVAFGYNVPRYSNTQWESSAIWSTSALTVTDGVVSLYAIGVA